MRKQLSIFIVLFVIGLLILIAWGVWRNLPKPPILVGVLHSQTGYLAISEQPVMQATLAAIEDVNAHGGVLGRQVKAVVVDGKSDDRVFAHQVNALLTKEHVSVVFGGWTSSSRKAMIPALRAHNGLLFYSLPYEGLEQADEVVYTGLAPSQQLNVAVSYAVEHFGKKLLLVGSDSIFPHMANLIVKSLARSLGAEVCGESFIRFGSDEEASVLQQVASCRPDVIINSVDGDMNIALVKALRSQATAVPIISLRLGEPELKQLVAAVGPEAAKAHYVVAGYFQTLANEDNQAFLRALGSSRQSQGVSYPMKSAWDAVHIWAQAANLTGQVDPALLRYQLAGMSYHSPAGPVSIHVKNRHLWQPVMVGQATADGMFDVVWQSALPVAPEPWPSGHTREGWQMIARDWFLNWGRRWQAP